MEQERASQLPIVAWGLSIAVIMVSVAAWLPSLHGRYSSISNYRLFPLLGLIAFGLMWAHYVMGALRRFMGVPLEALLPYFKATSILVLIALLLHPGLLIFQLYRDGFGLPPNSYINNYVAPGMGWIAILGTISWLAFMAYELHRKFKDRQWWKYVELASDAAILAVYYHGLRLGADLQSGWFKYVWYGYGISLMLALGYVYMNKFSGRKPLVQEKISADNR